MCFRWVGNVVGEVGNAGKLVLLQDLPPPVGCNGLDPCNVVKLVLLQDPFSKRVRMLVRE